MKTNPYNILPGYVINEYKIILTPHEDLARRIMTIQKNFIEKYKVDYKATYLPQLIVATFKQIQAHEERIVNRLKMVAMAFPPVKIELKDFGSFPSHTIYINVASKIEITALVKKIRDEGQRLMKLDSENKPHFITDGHLTIARKLKPWQYEEAWPEYSNQRFTGRFIADKMLLLRKRGGDQRFTVMENLQFQNLPVETKQGELF